MFNNSILSFILIFYYFVLRDCGGWISVLYFYFGVIWSQNQLETLTIEVDVCTTFLGLPF